MDIIRYTPEQLMQLRESPLVHKPEGLPSIDQWMENANENGQRNKTRAQNNIRGDDSTVQENGGSQRSTLFQPKHGIRNTNAVSEDIILGPPKVAFASSSRVPKLSDLDKEEDVAHDRANLRDKFFKERESEKNKTGTSAARRPGREDLEGWMNVRGRRTSLSQDDQEQLARIGEHRSRFNRDGEEETPRRNGAGRNRFEQPWGRETPGSNAKETDTSQRGWRDREWTRGNRLEEDPEWMDTPVKKKDEIGMARFQRPKGPEWLEDESKDDKKPHTQEDFQRWKERMKASASGSDDKEITPEPEVPSKDTPPVSSKPITPLVFEGKDMFGIFGADRTKLDAPATTEGTPAPKPKPAKASRFAKLFSPQEEQQQQQQQQQQAPPPSQPPAMQEANGSNEDKEGFQRILQMLGSTNIASQPPTPASAANSRKASMFPPPEQQSPAPERETVPLQPQPLRHHMLRSREEKAGFIEQVLAPRGTPTEFKGPGAFGPYSPSIELGQGHEQVRKPDGRAESIRSPEERIQASPAASGMGPFGILQSSAGNQAPPPAQLSRDREFLLNLMTQTQRNTPPQPQNVRPPPPEINNFGGIFLENQPPFQQRKPTMPPGLMEDRQFPENDIRHESRRTAIEHPLSYEETMRRARRFNLPVDLHDPAVQEARRRNVDLAARPPVEHVMPPVPLRYDQMGGNMGIPQQPAFDRYSRMPSAIQNERQPPMTTMAPPPGLPPAPPARGPPGFGMGSMPGFSAGGTPIGHPSIQVQRGPPGTGPAGPAGMFPHGPPPPGYFSPPPPPGFAPGPGPMPMGLASPPEQPMMRMPAAGPPPGMMHPMFADRPLGARGQGQGQGPYGL
ncbi:uncharacterized protein K452DRAFT_296867 [Aplosporella prunicola CBS 121167]|uniref:Uncharacterized protein n=1 Tax=Aplosporella prunicola CBS 121167 TaxID=1176127 RepID=A0A6A6BKR0_9PEZI|nr:uncharacterized protein K452DRAFT_296867 [Aplosporella prunicola CBS 121167]KAF2143905.1 hypothetical protein K452DRAFT_296867 [Aplosporella prunicola CBS 121167]